MTFDISIRIAGQAGQGIQSISSVMGKLLVRHGYYVFINNDVESRIRGGHNYDQIRISNVPVQAPSDKVELLIALDAEKKGVDLPYLKNDGVMICDGRKSEVTSEKPKPLAIPLEQLALEAGGSKIMANTVAIGAAFAVLKFDLGPVSDHLATVFEAKGEAVVRFNQKCVEAGYRYVQQQFKGGFPYEIKAGEFKKKRMLINGSQAMALGAICSGLKFYSGYPMSPSTGIMETVAAMAEEYRIVVEQAEDEISAINMAIGASFAGVRAMTATSGGGFCLMVEALGLAGMTETPVVVINAQRPGPSTGLPTRTEQSDLKFAIHAGHGEYPKAVLAPGNAEQAFFAVAKAFNLADRYQTPVIILTDQLLNDSFITVDGFDLTRITIDRGKILNDKDLSSAGEYKRYALDKSGVSPRVIPGQTEAVLYADSDEHTEAGHITESAEVRNQQHEKRMSKLKGLGQEMNAPEFYPSLKGDIILLGWGSTYGVLKEAVDQMNSQDMSARLIHFSEIYPFPQCDFSKIIDDQEKIVSVENNYSGQFASIFSHETGLAISQKILKFDGRPFTAQEIINDVKEGL
ncbi:MAG: 2-oxoacid:acceptor oxidoreductase subunit alpha [bacterium]